VDATVRFRWPQHNGRSPVYYPYSYVYIGVLSRNASFEITHAYLRIHTSVQECNKDFRCTNIYECTSMCSFRNNIRILFSRYDLFVEILVYCLITFICLGRDLKKVRVTTVFLFLCFFLARNPLMSSVLFFSN